MSASADRPRVVFDCNVLVQAISNESGPAGRALGLLEQNLISVYVSRAVLKELRLVLHYPSVRQKLHDLDDEQIDSFIQQLTFRGTLLRRVPHVFDYPRAQQDEP
jgi:putative PIN family toxin of toxin-antitoxin system